MRIACLADVHASDDHPMSQIMPVGFSDRLLDIEGSLCEVFSAKVDAVVICGDLYHKRLLDAPTTSIVTEVLSKDWGKPIYVLPGNHDAHDASGKHYNVNYLGLIGCKNVIIITQPNLIRDNPADGRLIAMPYYPERLAKQRLAKLDGDVLFCHQTIAGCAQGGWISKTGLTASDYKQFKHVVAGHFHEQQEFEKGFYLGSLTQLGWTETPSKGYTILDIVGGEIVDKEFVEVKNSPIFIKAPWNSTPDKQSLLANLKEIAKANTKDCYVHFDFGCTPKEALQLKIDLKETVESLPQQIRALRWNIHSLQEKKAVPSNQKPGALPSLEVLMRDYVEMDPNVEAGTNKEKILDVGNGILEEARS